jgi:hypothetical protein
LQAPRCWPCNPLTMSRQSEATVILPTSKSTARARASLHAKVSKHHGSTNPSKTTAEVPR